MRLCSIFVSKTKALISCAVTAQLICAFVFAYTKSRFSHDAAHLKVYSYLFFHNFFEIARHGCHSTSYTRGLENTRKILHQIHQKCENIGKSRMAKFISEPQFSHRSDTNQPLQPQILT